MTSAEFVAELKPLLEARGGLAGVAVHLTAAEVVAPAIVLIWEGVEHEITWIAMGPKRTDEVTVSGYVVTTSDVMQTAANQALAILSEIGLQVVVSPPQVGAQTQKANLSKIRWAPVPNDKGGWFVRALFDIEYTSNLA